MKYYTVHKNDYNNSFLNYLISRTIKMPTYWRGNFFLACVLIFVKAAFLEQEPKVITNFPFRINGEDIYYFCILSLLFFFPILDKFIDWGSVFFYDDIKKTFSFSTPLSMKRSYSFDEIHGIFEDLSSDSYLISLGRGLGAGHARIVKRKREGIDPFISLVLNHRSDLKIIEYKNYKLKKR